MCRNTKNPFARTAVASIIALSALGLSACGDTAGSEAGADVEAIQEEADDGYDGIYNSDFYADMNSYVGEEVTVSADVNEVVSPTAFTIAGTDDTSVNEMLVVGAEETADLDSDLAVAVTGTVQQDFDLPSVEEELGIDLDDELFDGWDGEPYIEATSVDTSVSADQ